MTGKLSLNFWTIALNNPSNFKSFRPAVTRNFHYNQIAYFWHS
jgi:hypothetical protein